MKIATVIDAQVLVRQTEMPLSRIKKVKTVLCPSFVHLIPCINVSNNNVFIGAQNCHTKPRASATGETSALQLVDAGVSYVILGHSERRALGETNSDINTKIRSAVRSRLKPIVCVGETNRDDKDYLDFVDNQIRETFDGFSEDEIKKIIIAYEPVWAIGAGAERECTASECAKVVTKIYDTLKDMYGIDLSHSVTVLFGGSANIDNATSYLTAGKVTGLLLGRASLDASQMVKIVELAETIANS